MITCVGIDQTGATLPGKPHIPRPLPMAWVDESTRTLQISPRGLHRLCPEQIRAELGRNPRNSQEVFVLLDCVLGLPRALGPRAFELALEELQVLETQNPSAPFGRKAAESFFKKLLKHHGFSAPSALPTRRCEVLAGANSVFKTRPFQKNIQTGTYRLWREIARNRKAFALWPFDAVSKPALPVFEGYPSFLWKSVFGFPSRKPQQLSQALRKLGFRMTSTTARALTRDANLADAAVLAAGGLILHERSHLIPRGFSLTQASALHRDRHQDWQEGWIAGLLE